MNLSESLRVDKELFLGGWNWYENTMNLLINTLITIITPVISIYFMNKFSLRKI